MKVGDLVRDKTSNLIRIGIILKPWSHMGAIVRWNDGEYDFWSFTDMEVFSESR